MAADDFLASSDMPDLVRKVRARTPARLLTGRVGAAYRTATQIELREAHASARDAVRMELDLERDLGRPLLERWKLFEVCTMASNKDEYLMQPDRGRNFRDDSREKIRAHCPMSPALQIAVGDGLSVTAVRSQVPSLLPLLCEGAEARGWSVGQTFVIRHCRVGILNEIGELLRPTVAVLLIGERPGLSTSESLSAYMAFGPDHTHSDADRNLISNIHARGIVVREAATRILNFADLMMATGISGSLLKEETTK